MASLLDLPVELVVFNVKKTDPGNQNSGTSNTPGLCGSVRPWWACLQDQPSICLPNLKP